jgi:Zn-finger nucleic acid-binding protein
MECPKCQASMEAVRFEETEVDRCVRCGGLWFDLMEDEVLRGRAGSESIDSGPAWQASMHDVQEKVVCPVDGARMVRMIDPGQPDLWVESCPVCHGTFFDAGEFTAFKEHTIGVLLKHRRRERAPRSAGADASSGRPGPRSEGG